MKRLIIEINEKDEANLKIEGNITLFDLFMTVAALVNMGEQQVEDFRIEIMNMLMKGSK